MHIGGGVLSANLACSGAWTYTRVGDTVKPGIDFYSDSSGRKGQALALQEYAATQREGRRAADRANDYGFAAIVQACVTNWLTSPAIQNVATVMTRAGYAAVPYTILGQTYTSPVPYSSGFRYPETGWTRQSVGGCGVWNRDANWAQDPVVRTFNDTIKAAVTAAALPQVKLFDAAVRELALRNCMRQAYNAGAVRGGTCRRGANGLNSRGEPNMTLG